MRPQPTDSSPLPGYFDGPTPRVIAHRGLTIAAPENTLRAFRAALDAGATHLETDVHATVDGVAVLLHDADLLRVTGDPRKVAAVTLEDVQRLSLRPTGDPLTGVQNAGGQDRVCTLSEALAAFPQARFNIDVKAADAVGPTVAAIRGAAAQNRVLVTSFSERRRAATVRQLPGIATSASASTALIAVLAARIGANFLVTAALRNVHAVQLPERLLGLRSSAPSSIAALHRAGVEVHFWTVNRPADMARLLTAGADGLVTDRADLAVIEAPEQL